jgi:hypothetical protein
MLGHGGRGSSSSRGVPAPAPETYRISGVCAAPAARPLTPDEFSRLGREADRQYQIGSFLGGGMKPWQLTTLLA